MRSLTAYPVARCYDGILKNSRRLLTAVLLISYVPAYGFADVVSEDSYAASDGETGETIAPEDAAVLSDNVEEVEDAVALFNAEQGESVPEFHRH